MLSYDLAIGTNHSTYKLKRATATPFIVLPDLLSDPPSLSAAQAHLFNRPMF